MRSICPSKWRSIGDLIMMQSKPKSGYLSPKSRCGLLNVMNKNLIQAYIFILFLLFVVSSGSTKAEENKLTHPVFWSDIVEIPNKGVVEEVQGNISILKKNSQKGEYVDLIVGQQIEEEDILQINPKATLSVKFGKDQILKSKESESTKFVTFKYIK